MRVKFSAGAGTLLPVEGKTTRRFYGYLKLGDVVEINAADLDERFVDLPEATPPAPQTEVQTTPPATPPASTPLAKLTLPKKAISALQDAGIPDVEALANADPEQVKAALELTEEAALELIVKAVQHLEA